MKNINVLCLTITSATRLTENTVTIYYIPVNTLDLRNYSKEGSYKFPFCDYKCVFASLC